MARQGKPVTPVPTEAEILRTCLSVLAAHCVLCWRNNTGAFAGTHDGKRRFVRFGSPGMPDIMGILPGGRVLAVECKRPGRRPTQQQIAWLKSINEQGGLAFWTDDPKWVEAVVCYATTCPDVTIRMDDDGACTVTRRD